MNKKAYFIVATVLAGIATFVGVKKKTKFGICSYEMQDRLI
jgi:hypothetical protein